MGSWANCAMRGVHGTHAIHAARWMGGGEPGLLCAAAYLPGNLLSLGPWPPLSCLLTSALRGGHARVVWNMLIWCPPAKLQPGPSKPMVWDGLPWAIKPNEDPVVLLLFS